MTEIIDLENISEELDDDSVYGKDDNNNQRVDVEAPVDSMLDVWVHVLLFQELWMDKLKFLVPKEIVGLRRWASKLKI